LADNFLFYFYDSIYFLQFKSKLFKLLYESLFLKYSSYLVDLSLSFNALQISTTLSNQCVSSYHASNGSPKLFNKMNYSKQCV